MLTEEYVAMGGLITIIAAALALIIKQLEASRCTNIRCCQDRRAERTKRRLVHNSYFL